jgi:hypothetical protein
MPKTFALKSLKERTDPNKSMSIRIITLRGNSISSSFRQRLLFCNRHDSRLVSRLRNLRSLQWWHRRSGPSLDLSWARLLGMSRCQNYLQRRLDLLLRRSDLQIV